jgi:DNA-binding MarR family transcriptional regulator
MLQKTVQDREWEESIKKLPEDRKYPAIPPQVWLYDFRSTEFKLLVYLATKCADNQQFGGTFTPKRLRFSQRDIAERIKMSSGSVNEGLAVLAQMKIVVRTKRPRTPFSMTRNDKQFLSSMAEELVVVSIQFWAPPWELEQARRDVRKEKEFRQERIKRSQTKASKKEE